MKLITEPYLVQKERWPQKGKHILAQYDSERIVVYQAYHPSIGNFASHNNYFGGPFKMSRMSWIKPNFLWMMYRSGWGTKENQEITLAIHLKREAFEHILASVVHSSYRESVYQSQTDWKRALQFSDVRLQWDPDHDPLGNKVARRAIQLGLRGETLEKYAQEWILEIEDISSFVAEQKEYIQAGRWTELLLPKEEIYFIKDKAIAEKVGIDLVEPLGG